MRNCCGLLILFAVVYGAQSSPDVSELQEKKTAENAATSSNETISKDITHPSITTPAITTHNITTPTTTPQPTTIPTHPTTTKPNTITTAKPTTTTTKPNTTTSATTTTTPQPTTTSTTKPTTTSKPAPPKPVPNPEENHWILNITGTNRTCLVLNIAAQIELPINGTNSTQKINIPSHNVTYSGTCSTDKNSTVVLQSNLAVMWQSNTSNTNYSIFFEFSRNHSKYDISAIKADIIEQATNASNPTTKTLYHNKQEFTVSEGKSYRCAKVQTLNFTDGQSNATVGWLHVSHLQYQAFVNRTDDKFESAWDCESSGNNSDVVPIVVGCVLMVLILVILAAYIIGRRRWNARGYLSM